MKRIWLLIRLLCAPALMGLAPSPDAATPGAAAPRLSQECAAPFESALHGPSLNQLATALETRHDFDVLAIGSTSMLGPVGLPRDAFTYRAIDFLAASHPGTKITLVPRTARGALATDMLATLQNELAAHQYPLVFWQAGSVEALRSIPVDDFRRTLSEGAKLVREAHGSLILIDAQYSRLMNSKVDVAPYESVMHEVALASGVTLFPRFDLTREWVNSSRIDLERASQGERQKTADHLNECLGKALATIMGSDTDPAPFSK